MREMSERKQWVIVILIIILAALADNVSDDPAVHHVCTDTTHALCDGKCECDGQECPTE